MAYQIKLTPIANYELDEILMYLEEQHSAELAADVLLKVYKVYETLSLFPFIGTKEVRSKSIRGFVMSKYLKLFYRVVDQDVIILNFFDTRQNPNRKR